MGLCLSEVAPLLATIDWTGYWEWTVSILMAAAGLGFLIFVHELGHFAVAKWCGVQCDKFMVGFDIGGYKISRKWGDTVYGIGILPLGGYVKMMGQDDDPRVTTEQLQQSMASDDTVATKEITGPGGEKFVVDGRSYLAKSVPQRMAIISAGVIMNIIFAFIFAVVAFRIGVPSSPCVVGATVPGSPAYVNQLRPGDEITKLGDLEDPWLVFVRLREEVTLAGSGEPLNFQVKRVNGEIDELALVPDRGGQLPAIGITTPPIPVLAKRKPYVEHSPAGGVAEQLVPRATIVSVNGQAIDDYRDMLAILVANLSEPLEVTLRPPKEKDDSQPADVTVKLPANQREWVGIAVAAGAIVAVEKSSPAAEAGLEPGDRIVAIDDQVIDGTGDAATTMNPLDAAEYCRQQAVAGKVVALRIRKADSEDAETIEIAPRPVTWLEEPIHAYDPISIPALGVALPLSTKIASVAPGSAAEKADIEIGDEIVSVKFVAPEGEKLRISKKSIDLTDPSFGWSGVSMAMQDLPPGTVLELTLKRSESADPIAVELPIESDKSAFEAERGLVLQPLLKTRIGRTFGEQLSMGAYETQRALTSVYRFLNRLAGGDISPTMMGGPITIAQGATRYAMNGWGMFLIFLTLISANLAVVNFLPIPVLDGGHMAFLIYEGITGRPAPEKFVTALSLIGLCLILTLMIWVFGLDISRLMGWM